MKKITELFRKLHNDENGDIPVGPILLVGLIAIPLVVALIAFSEALLEWLSTQFAKITGAKDVTMPIK